MSDSVNTPLPKSTCGDCKQEVVKQFTKFHQSPDGHDTTKKRRKFSDDTGRLWHGTRCPDCAAKWRKDRATRCAEELNAALKAELGE